MRELPVRKPNRLKAYDYSASGAYFVTVCTTEKASRFWVGDGSPVPQLSAEGCAAERCLQRIPEHFPGVRVEIYAIMPNHLHAVLSWDQDGGTGNPSPTLGRVMGWFKYAAAAEINRMGGTPGKPVFQRSYYDHVIRNREDALRIWDYIQQNPAKWQEDTYYQP